MKRHLGPALAATLVLAAGAALARSDASQAAAAQEPSAIERLTNLEKQVAQLKAQLEAERTPSTKGDAAPGSEPVKELAELRRQMDQVLAYLEAQAQSAAQLQAALEDSRVKGFTYGINPDSRVVLLEGFGQFTTSLQTDVPTAKKPASAAGQARR
jgi:hypothetical protein